MCGHSAGPRWSLPLNPWCLSCLILYSLWLALLPHLKACFLPSSTWNIYWLLVNFWCLEYTGVNLSSLFCTYALWLADVHLSPICEYMPALFPPPLPPNKSCFRNIWNGFKNSFFAVWSLGPWDMWWSCCLNYSQSRRETSSKDWSPQEQYIC